MSKQNVALYGLNHGEISKHALGRVDVDRLRLAAEEQVNWMPMTIGPAMLRPGMGYLGATKSDARARCLPVRVRDGRQGTDRNHQCELLASVGG
jgi:hypothetical protein